MIKNKLIEMWNSENYSINAWLSIPNSFTAEAMSKMGWDSLTIDMQHGQNDYLASIPMIQAISNNGCIPFARVPWNEPGIIMKMIDLGTLGIISPMINTKEDCEKFVSYCHYPPLGVRSFGPMRGILKFGPEYYKYANDNIISLAMIETKEAVENLDEILSVKNLNGVYIGPADMSISYGKQPKFDVEDDPIYSNIKLIVQKAKQYKKIAGIHNGSVRYAKEMIKLGYQFITVSSDYRAMTTYSQSIVEDLQNNKKHDEDQTY